MSQLKGELQALKQANPPQPVVIPQPSVPYWPLPPQDIAQRVQVVFAKYYVAHMSYTLGYTRATKTGSNNWTTLIAEQIFTTGIQTFKVKVVACDDSKTGGMIIGLLDASTISNHANDYFIGQLASVITGTGIRKNDAGLTGQWKLKSGNTFEYGLGDVITITVNMNNRSAKFENQKNNKWFEIAGLPARVVPAVSFGYANQSVEFSL